MSFRQTDEGARCLLGVPGRPEDTEELLNDLSHVEEPDTALREGDGVSGDHPWLEGAHATEQLSLCATTTEPTCHSY